MKRSRSVRKHLIPVCMVLAFALLPGLTLNLYEPVKRLTQKKVVNPENVLNDDTINYVSYVAKEGITYLEVRKKQLEEWRNECGCEKREVIDGLSLDCSMMGEGALSILNDLQNFLDGKIELTDSFSL